MTRTAQIILVTLLTFSQSSLASDWQLSVTTGLGQANDPAETGSSVDAELEIDSVIYIVANRFEREDIDGARLYSEYLIAANTITAEVSGGATYETEIQNLHMQVGGIYEWSNSSPLQPYFAMTLGLSHYSPELVDEETFFSGTVGLGGKIKLTDKLGLRIEARALGTLLDASSTIFCNEEDECAFGVDGNLWTQQHFTAGLSWSF